MPIKEIGTVPNTLFLHSKRFDQGFGIVDKRQASRIVALDGTGDFSSIQPALNDLPSDGGVIYVKEGTYNITEKLVINKQNVALIGAGMGTHVTTDEDINLVDVTHNHFRIQDMRFTGSGNLDYGGSALNIRAGYGFVLNVWIDSASANGIALLSSGEYTFVYNCLITASKLSGIGVWGDSNMIIGNLITSNTTFGVYVQSCEKNMIANNVVESNVATGIQLQAADNCVITGNVCRDNDYNDAGTYHGIAVDLSDNNIVVGNRCYDNDDYGIEIGASSSKNNVSANICVGNTSGGVSDSGANTELSGANIVA